MSQPFKVAVNLFAAALAGCMSTSASAAKEEKQVLMPQDPQTNALYQQFGFSEAVIDRGTVYISGVIATAPTEGQSQADSIDAAFQHIGDILERAGSSWEDVVDVTSFHTDLAASGQTFVTVKHKYLKPPFSAWTAIGIDALFLPGAIVEIKVVARVTTDADR